MKKLFAVLSVPACILLAVLSWYSFTRANAPELIPAGRDIRAENARCILYHKGKPAVEFHTAVAFMSERNGTVRTQKAEGSFALQDVRFSCGGIRYNANERGVTAAGPVTITAGDARITAKTCRYLMDNDIITAPGGLVISTRDATAKASGGKVDIREGRIRLTDTEMTIHTGK
ncbi:MAG: hypothetical protein IK083_08195 [Abditibacteriota bacterium]|nr:hypothetical protein [Abditibacteriota bacterium]